MKYWHPFRLLLASAIAAAISAGVSLNATAQSTLTTSAASTTPASSRTSARSMVLEEVVVTARRREEAIQDVAISMTVFNQRQLDDANIINAGDLANYTPSLQSNTRFGGDNTTFSIRGFSQELRTTASVGIYFAEVIAPRGANSQQSGDGAGPGDFFDLANVQVLKGPTGTLYGRNTTGGAVLLTPQRPTDEFEGYVEVGAGNYNMFRQQAVVNIPVTDNFKIRLGIDNQKRDGYLDNISDIGPSHFADIDYTAYRASAVWDITDALENYTVIRYSDSGNNGYPGSLFACNPAGGLGALCQPDMDRRIAAGNNDFYDVFNFIPKPVNEQEMFQISNTTTWEINDNLTLKNILAYSTLETRQRSALYGTDWQLGGEHLIFQMVGLREGLDTTNQKTWVEEIQLQGTSLDERLTWQTGLYYEKSSPREDYGAQSAALIFCDQNTITSANPAEFRCNNLLGRGALQHVPGGVEYINKAVYGQFTYNFTDAFSVTAGLRYTDDETRGYTHERIYIFPGGSPGSYFPYASINEEIRTPKTSSEEPTWLLGVDYKPTDDMLLYAKYSRGYRQGSVNIGGSTGLDIHEPETVDTYEIGMKNTFSGSVPATLNVSAFYNDFTDQQLQFGYFKTTGVGTTAVVNAGASTIWGVEIEGNVQLTEQLILSGSYSYLNTNVDDVTFPEVPPNTVSGNLSTTTAEGEPLSYAPENKLVMTLTWLLPISEEAGDARLSLTYAYTDEMQAVSKDTSIYATLDDYGLVNLNFSWDRIFGSQFDVSAFVTNLTDEEYTTFLTGNWLNGLEVGQVGIPRMFGARARYNF